MKTKRTRRSVRQCPHCGASSWVCDSRDEAGRLRRRRECLSCEERWSTVEIPLAAYRALIEAKTALDEANVALGSAAVAVESARRIIQSLEGADDQKLD